VSITPEMQTVNVAYFQRKVQLSRFFACLDGSPSQLIRISGVIPYVEMAQKYVFRNSLELIILVEHLRKDSVRKLLVT